MTISLYNFNYHPGYDLKELEEQPLVDNPNVKTIKKTIKGIKQKMGQLALKKQQAESKIKIRKDVRLERKLVDLQKKIDEYNKELEAFHAALKEMPDKVSIIEVLRDRPMNKADLEKKKIYDLIQMIAFHSREHRLPSFVHVMMIRET